MARAALRHIVLGLAATGLLAGCVDSGGQGAGGTTSTGLAPAPVRSGTAEEVEAPDVFQTTDTALWDGRPSLGGIWVASPDVVDPERVVMVNLATGQSVTGALFRRERDNPGPTLQISSDAAEALGILAGQPTEIRVTALRKVEVEAPVPVAEAASAEAAAPEAEEATKTPAATEAEAIAAAALDATGATVEAAAETVDAAAGTADEAAAEPPKRKTWKERRAEAKAKREAEKAARDAEKAAAAAAAAAADGTEAPTADSVTTGEIETAPLDARAPDAVASAPEVAAPAPEAPAPAATGAGRPIQIASFSKEENAKRAVEALAKIGITAQPQRSERNGTAVWGVVAFGDQALLAKIKDAGFADAYFLK